MKIALSQLNYCIGNFEQNTKKIIDAALKAKRKVLIWWFFLSCRFVAISLTIVWSLTIFWRIVSPLWTKLLKNATKFQ